jgi:hypothetical protein
MRITVRFLPPPVIERQLDVDDDMTVDALRARLEEELRLLGIAAPIRGLFSGTRAMGTMDRSLADYSISEGTVVNALMNLPPVELSVATDWGVVTMSVPAHTALSTVRQRLRDTHNIDTSGLALLCGGEPLNDSVQLRSVNVGAGAGLTLARVP